MKTLAALSVLLPVIAAHTRFTTLFVNSQSQGDGTCIRMDMNPSTTTDWIPGISSAEMACGIQGNTAVDRTCLLKAGDSISLLHRLWADGSQPGSIDPSHKGSTAVYMKKLADATSTDPFFTQASGDGWFKIAWDGLDTSSGQWGTEKMIANNGMVSATVPSDLSSGYYLVRSEILAMQNIVDGKVQPQFYAGCAQVYLTGNGATGASPETVSIPGYIDDTTSALSYDIYSTRTPAVPYQEFGPKIHGAPSSTTAKFLMEKRKNRANDDDSTSLWTSFSRWAGHHRPWGNNASGASNSSTDSSGNTLLNVVDSDSGSDTTIADSEYSSDTSSSIAGSGRSTTTAQPSTSVSSKGATTSTGVITSLNAAKSASTSSSSQSQSKPTTLASSSSSSAVPVGSCPGNTILSFANKCIAALESWTTDTAGSLPKCWAASQACWDKNTDCWANLSPAINANDQNAGCHLWESYCNKVVDWCKAGNLQGPPDAGFGGGSASGSQKKRDVQVTTRRNVAARHVLAAKRRSLK